MTFFQHAMFSRHIYVQIRENQFQARNIGNARTYQKKATPEFSHPRLLVGNFTAAQACLKSLLSEARGSGFALSTNVVIHPLERIEGGLCEVEERLFHELALGAGASKVVVWTGALLSDGEVLAKAKGG